MIARMEIVVLIAKHRLRLRTLSVRQQMEEEIDNPMEDLRVVVHDGKTHPVDSKEIAFVTVGRKAFLGAVANAHAIGLEPIVNLNIAAPTSAIGSIAGDLRSMRARINGETVLPDNQAVIAVQVPLAEIKTMGKGSRP
jgi:translation elongation factor EF-G